MSQAVTVRSRYAPLVALIILAAACSAPAADWNQWRGPGRNGAAPDSPPLLDALPPAGLSPVWISEHQVPAGGTGGWSCPVVANGRVYVFAHVRQRREGVKLPEEKFPALSQQQREQMEPEARDEYERRRREEQLARRELQYRYDEMLHCFDAETGRLIWTNIRESRLTRHPQSASPAVVDGMVFIHGARGAVRAVDTTTGKDVWQAHVPGDFDDQPHPASIAVADGVVVAVALGIHGLDTRTGKLLWQSEEELGIERSSPAVWRHGEREYVIAHAGKESICLDPRSGEVLWRVESLAGRSSPVVVGNRLITYGNSRKGGVRCFQITPTGAEPLWTNTAVADEGSSPVVVGRSVYVHGDRKLVCIDLDTGKTQWRTMLDMERPRYTSLIAADGKVIFAADGLLCLAADDEEYRPLIEAQFDAEGRVASVEYFRKLLKIDQLEQTAEGQKEAESLWREHVGRGGPMQCISPAIAEGHIYLRLKNDRLACYDLRARR